MTDRSISRQFISLWPLFVLLLAGAGLRLGMYDRTLGGGDENAMLLYFAATSFKYIATHYFDANNHIFHTLLVHAMAEGFGETTAWAIRLPTLLFGLGGLWLIHQLALRVSGCARTAWLALMVAVFNPMHIHYSQTARGYSLLIFFSAAVLLATWHVLESQGHRLRWATVWVACAFLSVYTLPTNVYFLAGLVPWMLAVRTVRGRSAMTDALPSWRLLIAMVLATGALCLAVWFPVLDQLINVARSHTLTKEHAGDATGWALDLLTSVPKTMFGGPVKAVLLFLVPGLLLTRLHRPEWRWLLVVVFALPLLLNALTGVAGFPRNYMFNFPLFVIFIAGGMNVTLNALKKIPSCFWRETFELALIGGFIIVSSWWLLVAYYPPQRVPDGRAYARAVADHSADGDLFLIESTQDYLYVRERYRENYKNILKTNRLTGLHLITRHPDSIANMKLSDAPGDAPLFKNLLAPGQIEPRDATGGKYIVPLTGNWSLPALENDFESRANWQTASGQGMVSVSGEHFVSGAAALEIRAESGDNVVLKTDLPVPITVARPSFIVLLWTVNSPEHSTALYQPVLSARVPGPGGRTGEVRFPLSKINDGMGVWLKEANSGLAGPLWSAKAAVGKIPPGTYNFTLWLMAEANATTRIDGLRLFFVEIPDELLHPGLKLAR